MKLEDQVVSLELAKKLKEFGIKQESLFYWTEYNKESNKIGIVYTKGKIIDANNQYSAFTVSEFGFLMPHSYEKNSNTYFIETTAGHTKFGYITVCSSHFYENEHDCIGIVGDDFDGDGNEANARAQMLIYLIENKLIEV